MNVYELSQQVQELMECLSELEQTEEKEQIIVDTLSAMGFSEKLESLVKIRQQMKADTIAIDEELKRLGNAKKGIDKGIRRVEEYITALISPLEDTKIKSGTFTISKTHSSRVNTDNADINSIPLQYIRVTQNKEFDKISIKEALENGEEIIGCFIEERNGVRIK